MAGRSRSLSRSRGRSRGKTTRGFKANASKIARRQHISMDSARRILAAGARKASPAAKRANPALKRVTVKKK